MSESSTRAQEKRESREKSMPMHYVDACTLGVEEFTDQITNALKHGFRPTTAHLALGEAIGSELFKLRKIEEDLQATKRSSNKVESLTREMESKTELINYIIKLAKTRMHIVGNDAPVSILKQFLGDSGTMSLDVADALNVATAIDAGCEKIFTTDPNFKGEKFKENTKNISKKHSGKALEIVYKERN